MELYILFVLIVALIGLVGLRKEGERTSEESIKLVSDYFDQKFEIKELKNTNRAYKGANTKHKETIEEKTTEWNNLVERFNKLCSQNSEQAKTIKTLNCSIDESYIAINSVGNESNKKKRLEQLDKYMTK